MISYKNVGEFFADILFGPISLAMRGPNSFHALMLFFSPKLNVGIINIIVYIYR